MNKMTQSIFHNAVYSGWEQEPPELLQYDMEHARKYTLEDIAQIEKALKHIPAIL